jgi:outer membrane receptor protein involved in Fe transport
VHFDEDGLPVLEFGDIAFGNADGFIKADTTIARVEVVRGGSAATFESNSPGGVINFISKTGEQDGGQIGLTRGINFDTTRLDFNYGGHINDSWRFDVGGFYHVGQGPLHAGFNAQNGGQIKGNITKELDKGFFRLSFKYLNDRTPTYLPTPFTISGSPTNPSYGSVPGFDVLTGSFLSKNLQTNSGIDLLNNRFRHNVRDGYHPVVEQVGAEFSYEIAPHTHLTDKGKASFISGDFMSPYTAGVDTAANVAAGTSLTEGATTLTGANFTLANGANAGSAYTGPVAMITFFDTQLHNFNYFVNKLEVSHDINTNKGVVTLTAGYYKSQQNINMEWDWNTYFMQVAGKNASLLNLNSTTNAPMTENGLFSYGAGFWGQCCQRYYDTSYATDAPYVSAAWTFGGLNVDAALRYDFGHATGSYYGSTSTAPYDVNGDGTLQAPEWNVPLSNPTSASPVDYSTHYLSWSVDANYAFNDRFAVFAGASRGGRTNADRLLFGTVNANGSINSQKLAVNMVTQYEGGIKYGGDHFHILVTPFYASTAETNYDVTKLAAHQNPFEDRVYHAYGVEFEGAYNIGNLALTGGATYTHSRIASDAISPADVNNTPQRQADWVYQASAVYYANPFTVGVNMNGSTDSYTDNTDSLIQPGYTLLNGFVQYDFAGGFSAQLNVNNILNDIAITEVDSGATATGYITARTMPGRTVSVNLRYHF